MKIICDSCGTKYSISDDKVRGKVFKIRCKKCSHIIVVRGGESGADGSGASARGRRWRRLAHRRRRRAGRPDSRRRRARPHRARRDQGRHLHLEGGLRRLAEDLRGPRVQRPGHGRKRARRRSATCSRPTPRRRSRPTAATEAAVAVARAPAVRCSATAAEGDVFAAPVAAAAPAGGDLFGSATHSPASSESRWPSAGGGGDVCQPPRRWPRRQPDRSAPRELGSVFAVEPAVAGDAQPEARGVDGRQRPAPTTEGSGLIDIRAMAANSGAARPADGRSAAAPPTTICPRSDRSLRRRPCCCRCPSGSGPPKWIYAVIVAMVGLVGVVGYLAFKVIMPKPAPVVVIQAPPAPAPAEPAKTVVAAKEPGAGDKAQHDPRRQAPAA